MCHHNDTRLHLLRSLINIAEWHLLLVACKWHGPFQFYEGCRSQQKEGTWWRLWGCLKTQYLNLIFDFWDSFLKWKAPSTCLNCSSWNQPSYMNVRHHWIPCNVNFYEDFDDGASGNLQVLLWCRAYRVQHKAFFEIMLLLNDISHIFPHMYICISQGGTLYL